MTTTTMDVAELIELAGGDENTGTAEERCAVIAARAELAERGVVTGSAAYAHLLAGAS